MADAATTTATTDTTAAATTAAAATTTAAKPWYEGKVDGELLGHMQNRGWHGKSAEDVAVEALRAHREAQTFMGVPESRLIKLPADQAKDSDGMRAVFQRLGAPKEAKEYDFSAIKSPDGKTLTEARAPLDAALRNAFYDANVPKDAAVRLAQAVVKHLDETANAQTAERTASIQEAKTALAKNWGKNFEANKFIASQAAQKLGITPDAVEAMEKNIGYDKVMDAFLQIGLKTGEARYVAGENPANGTVMSQEQAKARLAEMEGDMEFGKRLFAGDAAATREHQAILTMLFGEKAA